MAPLIKGMKGMAGRTGMLATGLLVVVTWVFSTAGLRGQTWEYVYGTAAGIEDGKFRVIPVTGTCATPGCCTQTDGYIAVGTAYPGQFDPTPSDVHVVRTDNNGARIWEYTYDITGNGDWDYGWSIIELSDGSGFVITGESQIGNNVEVFLLKINCNGAVVWSRTYGGPVNDGGRDLVEATTGNPLAGTNAGDIIVAGYSLGPGPFAGTQDGYLLRVRANGTLIWDQTYHYQPTGFPPGQHEFFFSLSELTPIGAASTGDIIAVGYTNDASPATQDGLVVRVNGDNGAIGLAPQGAAKFGIPIGTDCFYSVIELQDPANTIGGVPNVVVCGFFNGGWIDLVKLAGGNPCSVLIDRLIPSTTANTALQGRTIRQVTFAPGTGSVNRWDLALTGIYFAGTNSDAILVTVNPGTLLPAGIANRYGGAGMDEGWSVYPVDAVGGRTFGFVLCGHTTSWGTGFGAQDMYLLKTDGFGATTCETSLGVTDSTSTRYTCITMILDDIMLSTTRSSRRTSRNWGTQVCTPPRSGAASPELGFNSFDQEMAK